MPDEIGYIHHKQGDIVMGNKRPDFATACRKYVHRFTMEHVPQWARMQREDGTYYAPQYQSDREWYDNTVFPGELLHPMGKKHNGHCYSSEPSWPLGQSLLEPYRI